PPSLPAPFHRPAAISCFAKRIKCGPGSGQRLPPSGEGLAGVQASACLVSSAGSRSKLKLALRQAPRAVARLPAPGTVRARGKRLRQEHAARWATFNMGARSQPSVRRSIMRVVYAFRRSALYPDPGREAELPPKEARPAFLRKVKEIGFEG